MTRLFNALQLVVRRSKANWKLLSSIVVGVVVAVALLSSTPLYSNALNDLGLRHALDSQPIEMMDLYVSSSNNPIDRTEYDGNTAFIDQQIDSYVGPLVRQRERFVLTQGFNVMVAGQVIPTDPTRPRGYFQSYTNLDKHVTLVDGRLPGYSGNVASPEQIADLKGVSSRPSNVLLPDDMTSPDVEIEAVLS